MSDPLSYLIGFNLGICFGIMAAFVFMVFCEAIVVAVVSVVDWWRR